jgi:hypothetical protein
LFDYMPQVFDLNVGINLGGFEASMSQQTLHMTDACAASEKVSCARMAERVWGGFDAGLLGVPGDALSDHLLGQSPTSDGQPKGRRRSFRLRDWGLPIGAVSAVGFAFHPEPGGELRAGASDVA